MGPKLSAKWERLAVSGMGLRQVGQTVVEPSETFSSSAATTLGGDKNFPVRCYAAASHRNSGGLIRVKT